MTGKMLVRIREDHYLVLRAFLALHDLDLDGFLGLTQSCYCSGA